MCSVQGVRHVNLRNANAHLYVWTFLTVFLSILDLGLGVAFAIDYDTLRVNKRRVSAKRNALNLIPFHRITPTV